MEIVALIIGSYALLTLAGMVGGWLCYRFGVAHGRLYEITRAQHEVPEVDADHDN